MALYKKDRALVRRLLRGEREAFDDFFERTFPALYRFALARLAGDHDFAEEMAQETLCRAVRKLHTYRGEAALLTWLCTLCRHQIAAKQRLRTLPLVEWHGESPEIRAAIDSLAALDDGPQSEAERREMARRVRSTLDRLPTSYANVLCWKYLEELPVAEIAHRLDVGLKAAESRLVRARAAFREAWALGAGAAS